MKNLNLALRLFSFCVVTIIERLKMVKKIGDKYTCSYGSPVNKDDYGICSKMILLFCPLSKSVKSGDVETMGRDEIYKVKGK